MGDKLKLWFIPRLAYWAIRCIGCTLRYDVQGMEHHTAIKAAGEKIIYAFWHGRIFPTTYFWRDRGIVVMTSQHRDGDYIAPVIERFGYGSARGSSSRGSRGALVEMLHWLRRGRDVAFTIDGPRGPRYIAKPGAVWLSAKSGCPVLPLNIATQRKWTLRSWDLFNIPKPFSRVSILIGSPIYADPDAGEEELEAYQKELQRSLEDLLKQGDSRWSHP
jgi:lysophospholipid acyltransferase (LPLAT)-like uncharacterized protein